MKIGHILTVGTSLLQNTGKLEQMGTGELIKISKLDSELRTVALKELDGVAQRLQKCEDSSSRNSFHDSFQKLKPAYEFSLRPEGKKVEISGGTVTLNYHINRFSQELSFLWEYHDSNLDQFSQSKQIVMLLSADNPGSMNSSLIMKEILKTSPWERWYEFKSTDSSGCDFAQGINSENIKTFQREGINNWMTKIQAMIDFLTINHHCNKVILDVTGGFKGTVPYSTLMGFLNRENVELAYLFERAKGIAYIPAYPIGLDFRAWHEHALSLRMKLNPITSKYFNVPRLFEDLIQDHKLTQLGGALAKQYEKQLHEDPIRVYSQKIISRLLDPDNPTLSSHKREKPSDKPWTWNKDEVTKLRKILLTIVDKVGEMIWFGDRIPEFVEHAQSHHHNLLEFTELFLTPILNEDPDYLTAAERFVLLSAVLLHDSGHSLDRISLKECDELNCIFGARASKAQDIGDILLLFPSDVREFHQFLTVLRLQNKELAEMLEWPRRSGLEKAKINGNLHKAVLLACLYHRKRMPYDKKSKDGTFYLTGQTPITLSNAQKKSGSQCGVNLMKVVALLRLIDSCDIQARRAGHQDQVQLKNQWYDRDCESASIRAREAWQAFITVARGTPYESWEKALLQEVRNNGDIKVPYRLADKKSLIRLSALKKLHNSKVDDASNVKQCARLWLMAADAFDRVPLKFRQFPHFIKNLAVSTVDVEPGCQFGKDHYSFEIILTASEKKYKDPSTDKTLSIQQWLLEKTQVSKSQNKTYREWIEADMVEEYSSIQAYCERKINLSIRYYWRDKGGGKTEFGSRNQEGKN